MSTKDCVNCNDKIDVETALDIPFESIKPADEIVGEHLSIKANLKTEDDMRYERIIAESEDLNGWQKFFLAIIFAVLIFWISKGEAKNDVCRFGFFSFSFNSHEMNQTTHRLNGC